MSTLTIIEYTHNITTLIILCSTLREEHSTNMNEVAPNFLTLIPNKSSGPIRNLIIAVQFGDFNQGPRLRKEVIFATVQLAIVLVYMQELNLLPEHQKAVRQWP